MRFYTRQHQHYCGIDLHARTMYVCILDAAGTVLVHKDMAAAPEAFLKVIAPYRDDLVVAVECIFTWYWLADLCVRENIAFVLGHALYMKAIHGGSPPPASDTTPAGPRSLGRPSGRRSVNPPRNGRRELSRQR
jgi:hypothetical protein